MANWLILDEVKKWKFPFISAFQYDLITAAAIQAALDDSENLKSIDSSLDWEDDHWLRKHKDIPEAAKHAYRVAALVRDIRAGNLLQNAIHLDTFANGHCCCCISNGHHRIRALQFIGLKAGPFSLSGLLDELEELVRIAGCAVPLEAEGIVVKKLLEPADDDVVLDPAPESVSLA